MAIPYPEGRCYFKRSSLKWNNPYTYSAEQVEHFYSHFLLEYIWNLEANHGTPACNAHYHAPRSGYKVVRGSWWNTDFGNYTHLPFQYGPDPHKDIRRRVQHNLCVNGNRFKDREKGEAYESWFMTMPMPKKEEKWVWIDMLTGIRAIYIPLAHTASEDYPELCTFVQVNFSLGRKAKIWYNGDYFMEYQTSTTNGLNVQRGKTIGFNMAGLAGLLAIPHEFREANAYTSNFIRTVWSCDVKTAPLHAEYRDEWDFDYNAVLKANVGLSLEWTKPKPTWMEHFIKNTVSVALGFVPGVACINSLVSISTVEELMADAEFIRLFLAPLYIEHGRSMLPVLEDVKSINKGQKAPTSVDELGPDLMFLFTKVVLGEQTPVRKGYDGSGKTEVVSSEPPAEAKDDQGARQDDKEAYQWANDYIQSYVNDLSASGNA